MHQKVFFHLKGGAGQNMLLSYLTDDENGDCECERRWNVSGKSLIEITTVSMQMRTLHS